MFLEVKFLTFKVFLRTKSKQKVTGNCFCKTSIRYAKENDREKTERRRERERKVEGEIYRGRER